VDKDKRIFVIIFAILLAVYFIVLGWGLFREDDEKPSNTSPKLPSWITSMDSVTSLWAPRLDVAKLRCGSMRVDQKVRLDQNRSTCSINLTEGKQDDKDFWKVSLRLYQPRPDLFLEIIPAKPEDRPTNCLDSMPSRGLLAVFTESDSPPGGPPCWLPKNARKPLGFVVRSDVEANLTLRCLDCNRSDANQTIDFKLE